MENAPANPPAPLTLNKIKVIDHDCELIGAQFSPCGKFVIGGDYTSNIVRWDLASDAKVLIKGHKGWVQGVVFHPDGMQMFTSDSWGQLIAWNYAEDAPAPKWTAADCHPNWMRGLAISPDGSTLATCGADRFVRLWFSENGKLKQELPQQPDDLFCVAFHPDGKSLVSGDLKGVATHWDLAAGKVVRQLEARLLYSRPIVNGFVEVNDVGGIRGLVFDQAGTMLSCTGCQPITSGFFTGKPAIVVLDWVTGAQKYLLQPPDADPADGLVMQATLHPKGFYMASCSGQQGNGTLWCWKPEEKAPFFKIKDYMHCRSTTLHPDGKRMALTQVFVPEGVNVGNGRLSAENGKYLGLMSRIHLLELVLL